jgi:hypothetical protein
MGQAASGFLQVDCRRKRPGTSSLFPTLLLLSVFAEMETSHGGDGDQVPVPQL